MDPVHSTRITKFMITPETALVGSTVICVQGDEAFGLVKGKHYVIEEWDKAGTLVLLNGQGWGFWLASRFYPIEKQVVEPIEERPTYERLKMLLESTEAQVEHLIAAKGEAEKQLERWQGHYYDQVDKYHALRERIEKVLDGKP